MSSFTIIIPVFDETAALAFSKKYFASLGVQPLYVLDSKKAHRAPEVEALLGCPVALYENPGVCIEANYENLAALASTDWILRVDCDEVPNQALLAHASRFVEKPTDHYCAYDRDDLIWRDQKFERLKYAPLFFDSQFRLFNRREVKFISRIHTPGFRVPKWKLPLLPIWHGPPAARLYHLQREFTTPTQRAEKAERYSSAGQNARTRNWILRPDESFTWSSFHDDCFSEFFASWKLGVSV